MVYNAHTKILLEHNEEDCRQLHLPLNCNKINYKQVIRNE